MQKSNTLFKNKTYFFVGSFVLVGSLSVLALRAATNEAPFEAEQADLTGNVCKASDTNASAGEGIEFGGCPDVAMASSVSQYGITWNFDKEYAVGQFANGDYWVQGPLSITRITPDFTGTDNGWEVNPVNSSSQGFDSQVAGFSSSLVRALPYSAQPGDSIVKSISNIPGTGGCIDDPSHKCFLKTAAVLTVVGEIPTDNGATVFRPPYVGTNKPQYSVNSLRTDLLPSLAPVSNTPTLESIETRFKRVQLDHKSSWTTRYMHPEENLPMYGGDIQYGIVNGALRLMLDDPVQDKMPALIAYVQQGIDFYHMLKTGSNWHADGGHFVGRKLPVVFTAVLLDNQTMKDEIASAPVTKFSEDNHTFYGKNGVALWGKTDVSEQQYWQRITQGSGKRDAADPYGYVDGGGTEIGGAYQFCCTSQPYKAEALAAILLPGAREVWHHEAFFDYVDRWVNHGVWAQPDPCSLTDPGPDYTGVCVSGTGRFVDKHGNSPDGGHYRSTFAGNMWDAYR